MTENSPVCLSDLGSLQAQAPSVPTEGVTASGDDWIGWGKNERPKDLPLDPKLKIQWRSAHCGGVFPSNARDLHWDDNIAAYRLLPVKNRSVQPSVGMRGAARNEQSPEPVKDQAEQGVEAVAWRWRLSAETDWWMSFKQFGARQGEEEPLYSQATVLALQKREAGLRAEIERLTAERRCIVSHATMGATDGDGLSLNQVSVEITRFRNELHKGAGNG